MHQSLLVTKRDGRQERIDLDKIHRVLDWAAEGLGQVNVDVLAYPLQAVMPIFESVNEFPYFIGSTYPLNIRTLPIFELLKVMCNLGRSPPVTIRIKASIFNEIHSSFYLNTSKIHQLINIELIIKKITPDTKTKL